MKPTLITLFTALCCLSAMSQKRTYAHTYKNCYLTTKYVNYEAGICTGCLQRLEDDRLAKIAERKSREDALEARYKVEREAKQKALREELAKKRAANKSTEVLINNTPSPPSKPAPTPKTSAPLKLDYSKKDNTRSKLYARNASGPQGSYGMILNEEGDTIVNKSGSPSLKRVSEWSDRGTYLYNKQLSDRGAYGATYARLNIVDSEIPTDAVIVRLEDNTMNIMNSKAQLLLDDKDITQLYYCGNDFFVYFICPQESGNNNICFQTSNNYGGKSMVVYDYRLKKKYSFNPPTDVDGSRRLNRRYQIMGQMSTLITSDFLFYWIHPVDRGATDAQGYTISQDEHIKIGLDRKPVLVGTVESKSWGSKN
jgi:hypothetical protein